MPAAEVQTQGAEVQGLCLEIELLPDPSLDEALKRAVYPEKGSFPDKGSREKP